MVGDVLARGAACTLVSEPRLIPLFARSFPGIRLLALELDKSKQHIPANIDFQASLSHLGQHLRPSMAAFPQARTLLRADPAKTAALRAKYQAGDSKTPLIGFSWVSANQST